ncbi:unnamed protein product [Parnassius apollo]|uniref:(apollo) hypothetical protein n=1 Tax=Parnassius apollo TaxID=110799 RepID=A0A8S3WYD6_PARAO|nr:unnamed protein product [Parnassius apollo]
MKNRRRLLDSAIPSLFLPVLAPVPTISASADIAAKNTEIPVAGTSFKKTIAGSPRKDANNTPTPKNQNHCLETPTKQKRKFSPIPDTPSAFDTPVKKHLCRRIIELNNVVNKKDKKIKKLSDSNRRLKRQIVSLKSLLAKLVNKNLRLMST